MKTRLWVVLAVWLIPMMSAATRPARAQAPAGAPADARQELRREVVQLELSLMRAEALDAEIKAEEKLLAVVKPNQNGMDSRPLAAKELLWDEALGKHVPGEMAANPRLAEALDKSQTNERAAVEVWQAAVKRSLEFHDNRSKAERLIGHSVDAPRLSAGWGSSWDLILLGVVLVGAGMALTLHEARGRFRWWARSKVSRPSLEETIEDDADVGTKFASGSVGSRSSFLAAALALTLASAGAAAAEDTAAGGTEPPAADPVARQRQETEELTRLQAALRKKLAAAEATNSNGLQRLSRRLEDIRRERGTLALQPEEPTRQLQIEHGLAATKQLQEDFRAIRVSARLASRLADEAKELDQSLVADGKTLHTFVTESRDLVRRGSLKRLAACGVLALIMVVPMTYVRRGRLKQLKEESRKCPRCLNTDTLGPPDTDGGSQVKDPLWLCTCGYEVRENYIRENRLCFPTVGIRSSGKTHWMAMLYDQIKNANIPVAATIKKIPSREDARFDQLVKTLYHKGSGPAATGYTLPYPLAFHVRDKDPFGTNKTMVNLFDFSGEMREFTIDQDEFRRRALRCEGFTLFLDPTQVTEESDLTIEDQIQTLARFAEEMHAIRGIPSELPIDLPIAICVTKMDLLVTRSTIGTQGVPLVNALRETMGQPVDLALIQKRSQLCARALPQMFPNWNVERSLRESFGGRYMFFPLSSVGLEGMELGIEDLADRMIAPFGVIEPLLWLLHMHGYCVL